MKITVFTGNQPRHLSLIRDLSVVADQVYAIQECMTIAPGRVDDFYRRSSVMQEYFECVLAAEAKVFGPIAFMPRNVTTLSIKAGDLNLVPLQVLENALNSDIVVVFGASWIRPPLIDLLIERDAINIHMGVSPYYRGSSCNFWALYDGRPDLVGATIHKLSKGLDSGGILFHALPSTEFAPFEFGMRAVQSAHEGLIDAIGQGRLSVEPVAQDRSKEIRYTVNAQFTDSVAKEYLARKNDIKWVQQALKLSPKEEFIRVFRSQKV